MFCINSPRNGIRLKCKNNIVIKLFLKESKCKIFYRNPDLSLKYGT